MKLVIATDHNGAEFKKNLIEILNKEFEIIDASPENYPTDDFPDFAFKAAKLVLENENDAIGVLICGTGIGMCIAANKVKGIRCAQVSSAYAAMMAKMDDDANMMAIDSKMDVDFAVECIRAFSRAEFKSEEKYERRRKKIIDYENGAYNEL